MQQSTFPKPQIIHSAEELFSLIQGHSYSRIFVLCDENTHQLAWPIIEEQFVKHAVDYELHVEAAGEASKDWRVCMDIWEKLSNGRADRRTLFLNLGGGMITDLGAFVASVYKRGLAFIHLPTSLLGMTDAAIGGKCGIDFMNYKNQLGLFSAASSILIYPPFLKTLPIDERKSGFAEVLKHALIADADYWKNLQSINLADWKSLADRIAPSIEIKNSIVKEDPSERGERKKLNFGHTAGHALESFFMQEGHPIPHGFAIAAGMFVEAYLSMKYVELSKADFEEIAQLLSQYYIALDFSMNNLTEIMAYVQQDKKSEAGKSRFTLLKTIGEAAINIEVNENDLKEALITYLQHHGKV